MYISSLKNSLVSFRKIRFILIIFSSSKLIEVVKKLTTLKYKLNSQSLKTYRYENGYAKFERKGKFGMRDRKQRKVLPAIFLQIGQYDSLIPIIKEVDKWGYCDEEADLQIEYNYGYAENFVNRKAVVGSNGKYGVIGVQGDTLLPIEYTNIYRIRNLFACENEDGWWLLDSNLQVLNITPISRILKDNPVYLVLEMVNSRVYYWDWNKRAILRLN